MSTYQFQETLEKLPIPDLNQTCANYLNVLRPLQTEQEHIKTKTAVENFLKNGTGQYLDAALREYAQTRPSYIEQFWYDAYLNYDSPVVLNLNPFFLLEDDPFTNESSSVNPQVKRATSLVMSSLKFIQALKNETLSVDTLKGGKPLCMYQYTKLFGALRIPSEDGCVMQSDPASNHIVVMSKSQLYWFDVLDSKNNLILSEAELNVNFQSIIHDSLRTPSDEIAKSSFGVLTTENRRIWANVRHNLMSATNNKVNHEVLSIIDSALFVLCFDDIVINDLSELSKNMLCGLSILDNGIQVGTCTNRWYDKLQIIVTKNAKAGINFEHTGVDGHTVLRFVSDIYTDSILSFANSINSNAPSLWNTTTNYKELDGEDLITVPRKLEWELTPDLSLALRFGETRLSDLINQNEFRHLEFKNYGSTQIKKMKFSPDAFVQMAFQATYYALYGKVECTYEPAMTKQFYHGRTEAIRTVSQESNLFVRKFFDSTVSIQKKLEYLTQACTKHSQQTRMSSAGQGVDRHLYALFCIWKRYLHDAEDDDDDASKDQPSSTELSRDDTIIAQTNGDSTDDDDSTTVVGHGANHHHNLKSADLLKTIPEIFADNGWDKLNNTIISTSNCGNPSLRLFGFGPVSANGFGIGYILKDDSISICASSKHRQTQRFLVTLNSYLLEIQNIWKQAQKMEKLKVELAKAVEDAKPKEQKPGEAEGIVEPKPNNLSTLLGGYGYFDMGEEDIKSRGQSPEPPFLHRAGSGFSIREIGKKLRLSEY
ncbi:putative mitochondrial carnitine O-acetyltransferase [Candida viswanathii]|uniref:Putative mitochondrial carnitine O-acetyltransferase n=1 Tax=Candida viswanathii TaxID=5486 RepID=A0A367Y418_9ASCO|nr:putative mitochondrial carnitine O-acetyltransferase [Candida viswanathii]